MILKRLITLFEEVAFFANTQRTRGGVVKLTIKKLPTKRAFT